jgi:outer membrane protein, multidrug efflux system
MRKNMSQIKTKVILSLVILLAIGCKPTNTTTVAAPKPLPERYLLSKDTINSATFKWELFYKDQNLKQLITTALANNYDLQAAIQKIEIARANVNLNKGAQLPILSAALSAGQRRFGLFTMDGAGNASTDIRPGQVVPENLPDFIAGFNASWEVDVWGKLRSNKKAAVARFTGTLEGKNAVQTALIAEVASHYFELLALDNELDLIKETIVLQQEALDIIKVKKEAGIFNELAVKQFEGQVSNSMALEYKILQQITLTENNLHFLCGQFPTAIVREKANLSTLDLNQVLSGIPSQLLVNRPDIRQAEFDLLASKFDLKSAQAAFYPSFTITGSVGYQAFNTALLFQSPESIAYSILGGLTAPLLNRSAIKAKFNTAKANQTEALINYQKSILTGYIEVANELSNLEKLENLQKLKVQEVFSYEKSTGIANDLFKSGKATYLEVLMVQRTALESKIELITTKKLQHQATINLYKALGGGWQ